MWVRKTEEEKLEEERIEKINDEKTRVPKSLKSGLFIFIFTVVAETIASLTIGIPSMSHMPGVRDVIKFNELTEYLPRFLRLGAILGFATFIIIFFFKDKVQRTTIMCDKCHKSKNYDKVTQCECGGNFINIHNFKWVDDETLN